MVYDTGSWTPYGAIRHSRPAHRTPIRLPAHNVATSRRADKPNEIQEPGAATSTQPSGQPASGSAEVQSAGRDADTSTFEGSRRYAPHSRSVALSTLSPIIYIMTLRRFATTAERRRLILLSHHETWRNPLPLAVALR